VALIELSAKCPKSIEVEVNGAIADATTAKVRNKGLTQLVKQRATKQDRNPARASVGIDLREVSAFDRAGVKLENAVSNIGDHHGVSFEQAANNGNIADDRHVFQNAGRIGKKRGHHRFGD
jgi:hypothetical protein